MEELKVENFIQHYENCSDCIAFIFFGLDKNKTQDIKYRKELQTLYKFLKQNELYSDYIIQKPVKDHPDIELIKGNDIISLEITELDLANIGYSDNRGFITKQIEPQINRFENAIKCIFSAVDNNINVNINIDCQYIIEEYNKKNLRQSFDDIIQEIKEKKDDIYSKILPDMNNNGFCFYQLNVSKIIEYLSFSYEKKPGRRLKFVIVPYRELICQLEQTISNKIYKYKGKEMDNLILLISHSVYSCIDFLETDNNEIEFPSFTFDPFEKCYFIKFDRVYEIINK